MDNKIEDFLRKYWVTLLFGLIIMIDAFLFVRLDRNLPMVFIGFLWLAAIILLKLKAEISLYIALFFIIFSPFLAVSKNNIALEKISIWIFTLIVIGTIQAFIMQVRKNVKNFKRTSPERTFGKHG